MVERSANLPLRLRTVFISDIHLGFKGCSAELLLDAAANRVTARGRPVNLRGVEYRLLEFLMSHNGRTFNRHQLLDHVWGNDSDVDERTVDVNVQRLRRILAEFGYEDYIQTVRGYGYRFSAPAAAFPTALPAAAEPANEKHIT